LTASGRTSKFSFGLASQAMILLVVLLNAEFLFVNALGDELRKAEEEAARQDFARKVSANASKLMLLVYDTGDAVGKFAYTQQLDATMKYQSSNDEIPEIMKWLKKNLKSKSEFDQLLGRIQANIDICTPVLAEIHDDTEHLAPGDAVQNYRDRKDKIRKPIEELVADLTQLIESARKIEREAPDIERSQRNAFKKLLVYGLIANAVLAIVMAIFFTRRITKRLDVIVDNIERLKRGVPLNEPIQGSDEIASADAVFHEAAVDVMRQEALLKETERRLRLIIERVPLGLIVINQVGTIEVFNHSIEQAFGYEPHELLGKNISKLFGTPKQSGSRVLATLSERAFGKLVELNAVRKNGEEFAIDFTLTDVTFGQKKRRLAIILDATERLEIRRLRQSFVTMVSNELRNPLNDVEQFLGSFSEGEYGEVSEKATKESVRARDNVERLILLLNDLFDLEKLESGRIDIEPRWCSLQPILDKSVSAVTVFAQKHKVEIEVERADIPIYADSNRIVQVLINFLSNAVKYSPPEGRVKIDVIEVGNSIEMRVIDHGRGIPQSHLHAVFERFQQVEAADAKKKGGTGLGLAICKAIIEEHGGTIGVTSEEGKGSTFWFKLPSEERGGKA